MYTMRPNCNAGYAVLLTLLDAPVNIGEARGGLLAWTLCCVMAVSVWQLLSKWRL